MTRQRWHYEGFIMNNGDPELSSAPPAPQHGFGVVAGMPKSPGFRLVVLLLNDPKNAAIYALKNAVSIS
ncbi:MAG: hypothetical protein LBH11_03805 [Propionibacteriaceae bacterium]|nr:hypothetical protein [Propionibacteriaceae bacterium]